jgi:hypothetical protein
MSGAFSGRIAGFHMKRFRAQVDYSSMEKEGRIFSSFSLFFCAGILILCAALWLLILGSADSVTYLLVKWVDLFKIRQIFNFSLFDADAIAGLYHSFIAVVLVLVSIKTLLLLLARAFSVIFLSNDRLVIVESNFFASRIHQIPFDEISRVSARESILHRVLKLGTLEIATGERDAPLRLGPIPRFPSLFAAVLSAVEKK